MKKAKDAIVGYDFRTYLISVFQQRATAKPSYSFRSFAKNLGIDPSSLRKIVQGKRPLGQKTIRKLGEKLKLSEKELEPFLQASQMRRQLGTSTTNSDQQMLTAEEFEKVSHWYFYVIPELIKFPSFKPDPSWIAKVLGISRTEAESALDMLFELGWIAKNKDGSWTSQARSTTTDIKDPRTAVSRHRLISEIVHKCVEALEAFPRERRHHSATTVSIDSRLLPEAIEKIRAFRVELAEFLGEGREADEVYQILVGLYPLSDLQRKGN